MNRGAFISTTAISFLVLVRLASANQLIGQGTFRQFKSDATTPIGEGQTTMEDTVVFGATLQSSSTDQLRLEVEYTTGMTFTGVANVISSPVNPRSQATATASNLQNGSYRWRARAADTITGVASDWQEFGTAGTTDFVVHTVPLLTQNNSTWADDPYGNGGIGGFVEFPVTISAGDDFIFTVNAKDTSAPDGTRATFQINLTTSTISKSLVNKSVSFPHWCLPRPIWLANTGSQNTKLAQAAGSMMVRFLFS